MAAILTARAALTRLYENAAHNLQSNTVHYDEEFGLYLGPGFM
jgi:hypothetical protein